MTCLGPTVSVLGQFLDLEERFILAQEQPHSRADSSRVCSKINAYF